MYHTWHEIAPIRERSAKIRFWIHSNSKTIPDASHLFEFSNGDYDTILTRASIQNINYLYYLVILKRSWSVRVRTKFKKTLAILSFSYVYLISRNESVMFGAILPRLGMIFERINMEDCDAFSETLFYAFEFYIASLCTFFNFFQLFVNLAHNILYNLAYIVYLKSPLRKIDIHE